MITDFNVMRMKLETSFNESIFYAWESQLKCVSLSLFSVQKLIKDLNIVYRNLGSCYETEIDITGSGYKNFLLL